MFLANQNLGNFWMNNMTINSENATTYYFYWHIPHGDAVRYELLWKSEGTWMESGHTGRLTEVSWKHFFTDWGVNHTVIIAGFHHHAIKNKNQNHSIDKVQNLGNEWRWMNTKTFAKIQVGAIFHMQDIRWNVSPKN